MAEEHNRNVRIAENLKCYQELYQCSQAEFAEKLGIPKSTLQSVMQDGNTTLDTLIKIQQGLHISLDELVYGDMSVVASAGFHEFLKGISCYAEMGAEQQERMRYYLTGILEMLKQN